MTNSMMRFDNFEADDYACFKHLFDPADFASFSRLSGDTNPLHHDFEYAANSKFKQTIVPVHLTIAPLSRIAGMIFPGQPSLYLGHHIEALAPVFYGEELTYSAKVSSVNSSHRVLVLEVLVFGERGIVLTGTMRVQSLLEEWSEPQISARRSAKASRAALITGASGEIGSAIARVLAKDGWNLKLHFHSNGKAMASVAEECRSLGAHVETLGGSLEDETFVHELGRWAAGDESMAMAVHTASPGVHGGAASLMSVNYGAFKILTSHVVPRILEKQRGALVFLGSTAIQHVPDGWDDYATAKLAGASYLASLHRKVSGHGIHCFTLAPGLVRTRYSAAFREATDRALLPEEVAECLAGILKTTPTEDIYWVLEPGRPLRKGRFGFHEKAPSGSREAPMAQPTVPSGPSLPVSDLMEDLARVFRGVLGLDTRDDLQGLELGMTPRWDSLRHIELLLEIEKQFKISFSSREIDQTKSFKDIARLVAGRRPVPSEKG